MCELWPLRAVHLGLVSPFHSLCTYCRWSFGILVYKVCTLGRQPTIKPANGIRLHEFMYLSFM